MSAKEEPILTDYSQMVQNLADDYAALPVDRPEWLMKDIIQNSWDARVDKTNAKGWVFTIRVIVCGLGHTDVHKTINSHLGLCSTGQCQERSGGDQLFQHHDVVLSNRVKGVPNTL